MNDILPADIIDIIYKKKHNLEMKEISKDIQRLKKDKIDTLMKIIVYFQNIQMYFIDPDCIASIWTAFRNEGLMSDIQLEYILLHMFDDIILDNNIDIDIDKYMDDCDLSINSMIKENDEFIRDALIMYEEADIWLKENLN